MLAERSGREECLPSVHVTSTFFYPKLMEKGHSGLKRWTKTVDIFSKDIILIPVHTLHPQGMHWCLAVVDFRKPGIFYYDGYCSFSL